MCTRFVYNGSNTIVGFNFDIDLAVWKHKVIEKENIFFIGIKMPDNQYHSFHGVNKNGNYNSVSKNNYLISKLTEQFIIGSISLDDAIHIVKNKKIVYAPDTTMQARILYLEMTDLKEQKRG